MLLNNRHGSVDNDAYRYAFNGKEKDDEVKGEGAQYDYGFRIYDNRLGKFLSRDPLFKSFAEYTPYQFAGNKPIVAIDLDGLEEYFYWNTLNKEVSPLQLNLVLDEPGPVLAPDISEFGLFSTFQEAKEYGRLQEIKIQREREAANWARAVEARKEYNRLRNPVWIAYELSPFGAASSAIENGLNGDYGWAAIDVIFGALEVRGFINSRSFNTFDTGAFATLRSTARLGFTDDVAFQLGQIVERIYKSKNRPKFRKGVVEEVWKRAQDANGNVIDPNTGEILTWDKFKSRAGQWDMGHKPGKEWHKLRQEYIDGKKTWKEVLDEYNNPDNYLPESPSSNRSGAYEGSPRPSRETTTGG